MTYQQLETIRKRAIALGLQARWHGERVDQEAWLRVSRGIGEIEMIWFPGRTPFLRVAQEESWTTEIRGCSPLDLVHTALELVALHATLTAGLGPAVADVPSTAAQFIASLISGSEVYP